MGVRFIRQPSETPNINNSDDARLARYALGGQNGYIKDYGFELDHEIIGSTFKIKKGIAVLQGYEIEVDTNGWELEIDSVPSLRYYTVYCEINLATQTAEIKSMYDTAGYPAITAGDNLTSNTDGTARMVLYRFMAFVGVISSVKKIVGAINYVSDTINTKTINTEKIATTVPGTVLYRGYSIPTESIPSTRVSTIRSISGYSTVIGELSAGWYEVSLGGGGGGGSFVKNHPEAGGVGGNGGYLNAKFFVPYTVHYKLMSGEGGKAGGNSDLIDVSAGGGGGGGSVLDIPQLGILFIACGGGGGAITTVIGEGGQGGGGGGYGAGGAGSLDGGAGGGGGGCPGGHGSGGGSGGGQYGSFMASTPNSYVYVFGSRGGGYRGDGGGSIRGSLDGDHGGNNMNTYVYGAGFGNGAGGGHRQNGGDGSAKLWRLG